jgi:adenylate cyclase
MTSPDSASSPPPADTLPPGLSARLAHYLPPDLLGRATRAGGASDPDTLNALLQHLEALHHTTASFLPHHLAHMEPEALATREAHLWPGTFLFSDVSGFTALSERLASLGGEGAEQLTALMNDYFAVMLEILAKSGGILMKFAGDALLAFFPQAEDDPADTRHIGQAIRAGLRMQRAMPRFQPYQTGVGPGHLEMTVGIGSGQLFTARVGTRSQRDYVILGRLPAAAMAAEESGESGQVIVDEAAQRLAGERLTLQAAAPGMWLVIDDLADELDDFEIAVPAQIRRRRSVVMDQQPASLLAEVERSLERVEAVAAYLAPDLLSKIVAHSPAQAVEGEHRPTTVMFAHFTGIAEMLDGWVGHPGALRLAAEALDRFYSVVQLVINRYGGTLARCDPYQLGGKLLVAFGAPVAHPDDPLRAVASGREILHQAAVLDGRLRGELPAELLDRLHGPLVSVRMGLTHGQVFAGEVGWLTRREYTVMGHSVNLAARLMSKAGAGQVLVDRAVWERIGDDFECQPLGPMRVKGRDEPVAAYAVGGPCLRRAQVGEPASPLVGRRLQIESLRLALDKARRGEGVAPALSGEMGVGKTRLAREATRYAADQDMRMAWVTCVAHEQPAAYKPWADVLAQLTGLADLAAGPGRRARAGAVLDGLNLGPARRATIAALLELPPDRERLERGGPPPESGQTTDGQDVSPDGEDGETARHTMPPEPPGEMRARLDEHRGETISVVWDELRQQFDLPGAVVAALAAVARQKATLVVLDDLHWMDRRSIEVLARVVASQADSPLALLGTFEPDAPAAVAEAFGGMVMPLPDLTEPDMASMAASLLNATTLSPRLQAVLWKRTQGRPLFVETVIENLIERGAVCVDESEADLSGAERLTTVFPTIREMVLSHIDRLPADLRDALRIASVLGDSFDPQTLQALTDSPPDILGSTLKALVEAGLLGVVEAPQGRTFRFRHSLTREVAYGSLPLARRRELHRAAGDYWTGVSGLTVTARTLAAVHHYVLSGDMGRAVDALNLAGIQARRLGDEARALALCEQAWSYAARSDEMPSEVQASVAAALADLYALQGRFQEAARLYHEAAGLSESADLLGRLGLVALLDRPERAELRLARAVSLLEGKEDLPAPVWMTAALAWAEIRRSDPDAAARRCQGSDAPLLWCVQGMAEAARGNHESARAWIGWARDVWQRLGSPEGVALADLAATRPPDDADLTRALVSVALSEALSGKS